MNQNEITNMIGIGLKKKYTEINKYVFKDRVGVLQMQVAGWF